MNQPPRMHKLLDRRLRAFKRSKCNLPVILVILLSNTSRTRQRHDTLAVGGPNTGFVIAQTYTFSLSTENWDVA